MIKYDTVYVDKEGDMQDFVVDASSQLEKQSNKSCISALTQDE